MKEFSGYNKYVLICIICIITFFCFRYSLGNQFSDWDDDIYITKDTYIKALTWDNLKTIFTQDITKNNYHPFCMLSLALNYHFTQMEPMTYYLTNILIHIANVVLVFLLLWQISARLKVDELGTYFIAGFGALWFGIHPMHVESVSWIAERKDVLYTLFYLSGLLSYLQFIFTKKQKWYWITFVLFIASCLSKPMAVVFPLSLMCFDFLFEGKLVKKSLLQKIPFFLASFICGAFAVYTQNKTGAMAAFSALTIQERIMYASYGFVMYIYKMFNPTFLSTFYPYPYRYINGWLPNIYYLAPIIAIAILGVSLYLTYKRNKEYFKILAFGFGFFVSNIIFVLQFISCGAAIMADRYSYVAYIGLFFMLAYFMYEIAKKSATYKMVVIALLLAWSAFLANACYKRTFVWHNSVTLLTDAIQKYPYQALLSYKWLGNYYMDMGEWNKALENYIVLDQLNQADAKTYDNIGDIYNKTGAYNDALKELNKSLRIQNNVYKTYIDKAFTDAALGDTVTAVKDFLIARQLSPESQSKLAEVCFYAIQYKQYKPCGILYSALLAEDPQNPYYYFYRGIAKFGQNKLDKAISDWQISVKFNVKDVSPNAAYNIAVVSDSLGNDSAAVRYAILAKNMGYKVEQAYMDRLKAKEAARQNDDK
jgi:tetratricopeptide (TPR) repeat protein